jgi:hypothetical protein
LNGPEGAESEVFPHRSHSITNETWRARGLFPTAIRVITFVELAFSLDGGRIVQ